MGCCTSREQPTPPGEAPPLPPRRSASASNPPNIDIVHHRPPAECSTTLPPRLQNLADDQRAQLERLASPPPLPPKIPVLPPRPSQPQLRDPNRWQDVPAAIELADSGADFPVPFDPASITGITEAPAEPPSKLQRAPTSTLEVDLNPQGRSPPRAPTPELDGGNSNTSTSTGMWTPGTMSTSMSTNGMLTPGFAVPSRYQSPVSDLDPMDLRARSFSPVSALGAGERRRMSTVGGNGHYLELEAAPTGVPAMPVMSATVKGPVDATMYHELDGGSGAVEMPVRW